MVLVNIDYQFGEYVRANAALKRRFDQRLQ
jgi:hypothetical protein